MALSRSAQELVDRALEPDSPSEESRGVAFRTAQDRIMGARGTPEAKDEALRAVHAGAQRVAKRRDGAYVSNPRRQKAKLRHSAREKADLRKAALAEREAERLEKKAKDLRGKGTALKQETEASAEKRIAAEASAKEKKDIADKAKKMAKWAQRNAERARR